MCTWIKQQLISVISEKSLRQGKFKLASGKKSSYYVDMSQTSYDARGLELIGQAIECDLLRMQHKFNSVGGPALGALPIISSILRIPSRPIARGFAVRRALKKHGHECYVDGRLQKGDQVLLIEDVTTSGNSAVWAANLIQEKYDCTVVCIVTVLDRLEGAAKLLKDHGYEFHSILTANDLEFSLA